MVSEIVEEFCQKFSDSFSELTDWWAGLFNCHKLMMGISLLALFATIIAIRWWAL